MNFLLRTTHPVTPELPNHPALDIHKDVRQVTGSATTLEGLIAEDPFSKSSSSEDGDKDSDGVGDIGGVAVDSNSKNQIPAGNHSDVGDDEGWITIPYRELPQDWSNASDICQLRSLDRSFVFPGEQLHILVCLSASKQDKEILTPFKVAAVMCKNGSSGKKKAEASEDKSSTISEEVDANGTCDMNNGQITDKNGETPLTAESPRQDLSATESLLRMEDHKQQTETLLERFRNSNFFVRIAQADEPLWSKGHVADPSKTKSEMTGGRSSSSHAGSRDSRSNFVNAIIDRGSFDGNTSSGVARNTVRCYSLQNGDIVVLLQVNVAVSNIRDPVLEVLQFEKLNSLFLPNHDDPCQELLNWLLPLDRTLPPPRPLSPPLSSSSALGGATQRSTSVSSSSQIFSFGHFRSYSMPSLPQVSGPPSAVPPSNLRPAIDLEEFGRLSPDKILKSQDMVNEGLLSFRGVPLEPERFSVHCGLEGIYLAGRRWRRKLEIVQPIEIHSFAAECNTEDLLCVQIKNVSPAHLPDIVIFLDSITVIFEEASKSGPPLSLPIASIETGNGHTLPNLPLRRGEEHSFILKPATAIGRDLKGTAGTSSRPPNPEMGVNTLNMHTVSRVNDGKKVSPSTDQYAVLVSCHCNFTESKLFFKQPTNWRPRIVRDLMISVVSEMSEQTFGPNGKIPRLPVQVLTLQASNLTSDDLTLTVLAPVSSNSSPSVLPLNSAPTTPMSPFVGSLEFMGKVGGNRHGTRLQRLSSIPTATESQTESTGNGKRSVSLGQHTGSTSDVMSNTDLGCTHLWLQSTVPLGCVPAHSSATVKLELLPLTDGIITLDTLQVATKEKGLTYIPEQALKIYATSSAAAGIV